MFAGRPLRLYEDIFKCVKHSIDQCCFVLVQPDGVTNRLVAFLPYISVQQAPQRGLLGSCRRAIGVKDQSSLDLPINSDSETLNILATRSHNCTLHGSFGRTVINLGNDTRHPSDTHHCPLGTG